MCCLFELMKQIEGKTMDGVNYRMRLASSSERCSGQTYWGWSLGLHPRWSGRLRWYTSASPYLPSDSTSNQSWCSGVKRWCQARNQLLESARIWLISELTTQDWLQTWLIANSRQSNGNRSTASTSLMSRNKVKGWRPPPLTSGSKLGSSKTQGHPTSIFFACLS